MGLSCLGQARLKQKATGEALRLFGQAAGEANKVTEDQDQVQAKLMLVQLLLDADAAAGFEKATEAFKEINHFSDFDPYESILSLKLPVYGFKNFMPLNSPVRSSLWSAVEKMCRANCEETFQTSDMLEKKETRLWSTFVAAKTALSSKEQREKPERNP